MGTATVILAAGQGTRMKSSLPKVLHQAAGRPLVGWSVQAAATVSSLPPLVVVGYGKELVQASLGAQMQYAEQRELLGTGHAVRQAAPLLQGRADQVIVLYGDMPLIQATTLAQLAETYRAALQTVPAQPTALAMLTVERSDPQGFGRVVRDPTGKVLRIVEEVDCSPAEKAIRELNPGVYCFNAPWLWSNLDRLQLSAKGEYYLTDMVELAVQQGYQVVTQAAPPEEVYGVNDRSHLAVATAVLHRRIAKRHMLAGVTIVDPQTTYIDDQVQIGSDSLLLPGTLLQGQSRIGHHCTIGPHTLLRDSHVDDGCQVTCAVLEDAHLPPGSVVGPYQHLHANSAACAPLREQSALAS